MVLQLHHVYLVGVVIPNVLNDSSPAKMATAFSQTLEVSIGPDSVCVAPSTVNRSPYSVRRHFCVMLDYDPTTKIGILLLGTSRPQQPQRFVPCEGSIRLPFQPQHVVCLSPRGGFRSSGYFNFSHALRATIMVQGDAVVPSLPPQAFVTDQYANGTPINVFLELSEVEALKDLHIKYWTGIRYAADGTPIGAYDGVGGVGGAGGSVGGAGGGAGGSAGSVGGGAGGSAGGVGGGADGSVGGGGASGRSPPLFYPIGRGGTVSLSHPPSAEGESGSYRLARALLEEDERMAQLALIAGDYADLKPPDILACVEPMTAQAMEIIDSF